jgi:hypothetical protein
MNISTYFGLDKKGIRQPSLEFVDVVLDDDNELFIDPRLIEICTNPVFNAMRNCLKTYFNGFLSDVEKSNRSGIRNWLSGLSEPQETRLGYSIGNSKGNSIGKGLKPKLEAAVFTKKLFKTGRLTSLSDLELFVEDINCDRISDMTTKVIKKFLISFTQLQCKKLGIPMKACSQKDIFNPDTLKWEVGIVELPHYEDDPIIFAPKHFVRRQSDANSNMGFFYRFAVDKYVLTDPALLANIPKKGKDNSVLKKDIRESISSIKEAVSSWAIRFKHLLVDYRSNQAQERLKPLTNAELESIIYRSASSKAA